MSARKVMDDLACEKGCMEAAFVAEHASKVEVVSGGCNGRLMFECDLMGEELTWDPDLDDWDGPVLKTIAFKANELHHALEAERIRVQHKLTDICGDIWDYAKRYQLSMDAEGILNEERATLRRIIEKLIS